VPIERSRLVRLILWATILIGTGLTRAQDPTARDPENRTLVLRVVDRTTRAPIEGVAVEVEVDSGARDGLGGDERRLASLATGNDGQCRVEFPRSLPKRIYITAHKPGYADRGFAPFYEPGGRAIARAHTMELERGVSIGGIVKERNGRPVPGATVVVMARAGEDTAADYSYVPEVKVTTDATGRWRLDEMPPGWNFVYLRVTHPDYVPTSMMRNMPKPSDFELKTKRAETILDEGIAVTGTVLDDRGKLLAGATVGGGTDRQIMQRGFPSTTTDKLGGFRFAHIPNGTQTFTAQAQGRAPQLVDVVVEPEMKPLEFRLGPGQVLRGRVVDRNGKGLEGVTAQAMHWRGHSSLDWTTKTDLDGRFFWDSAPAEPVLLTLTRPGYVMLSQREFRAGAAETQVTMYPPLRVRGKVTDARTGRPLSRFTVVDGSYYRYAIQNGQFQQVDWERGGPWRVFSGGEYDIEYSHPLVAAVAVRIEADAKGREAWLAEWLKTDVGAAYSRAQRIYDTNVRPDGRFRVEDVEAGSYRLQAEVHVPGNGIPGSYGPDLARVSTVVTVPVVPGGRSDEALDLGDIELKAKR
jgi:hypothetical protein